MNVQTQPQEQIDAWIKNMYPKDLFFREEDLPSFKMIYKDISN